MRKFLSLVLILVLFSIGVAHLVPIQNGDHSYKTEKGEQLGFITYDTNMVLITAGGRATGLKLYVTSNEEIDNTNDVYFYKSDEEELVIIFDDECNGMIITSKEKILIRNISCEENKQQK